MNRAKRQKDKLRKQGQRALHRQTSSSPVNIHLEENLSPSATCISCNETIEKSQSMRSASSKEDNPIDYTGITGTHISTRDVSQAEQQYEAVSSTSIDPYRVSSLIGDGSTSLPDDIIQMAISPTALQDYIGYYTVAELVLQTTLKDQLFTKPVIPMNKFSINIHPLNNHWVTSCQHPNLNEIHIYDSLMTQDHLIEVTQQIRLIFGDGGVQRTKYKKVTQQSSSPICGVMAIAFAFSCFLGVSCESQFDIKKARFHLRQCMLAQEIRPFPLQKSFVAALTTECRIDEYLKDQNLKTMHQVSQTSKTKSGVAKENCNKIKPSINSKIENERKMKEREKKRKCRLNSDYKKHEQELRRQARSNPEKRKYEQELKRKARSDPEKKIHELELRRQTRSNPEKREFERDLKKKARSNPEKKIHELELRRQARSNPERRKFEQELKRKARSDPEKKIHELELSRQARSNPEKRKFEQELKRKARSNPEKKIHELELRRQARSNPERRKFEQELKRKARSDPEKKKHELELSRQARSNPERRKCEQELKRKARSDPEKKTHELELRRQARSNPEKRKFEQELKRKAMSNPEKKIHELEMSRQARSNPERRTCEQELKRKARSDPEKKKHEQELSRQARSNPEKRKYEQELKRKARSNPEKKKHEHDLRKKARQNPYSKFTELDKRRQLRLKPEKRISERILKRHSRKRLLKIDQLRRQSIHNLVTTFKRSINTSCDYECTCCAQLFFKQSVIKFPNTLSLTTALQKCKTETFSVDNIEWICHTCLSHLKKNRIPPLSKVNSMSFPPRPEVLELNKLEERLISPLNIFMQMRELPSGRQVSVRGNVVNVPADSISTVQTLPRRPGQSDTVPVKLKRRLRYNR